MNSGKKTLEKERQIIKYKLVTAPTQKRSFSDLIKFCASIKVYTWLRKDLQHFFQNLPHIFPHQILPFCIGMFAVFEIELRYGRYIFQ